MKALITITNHKHKVLMSREKPLINIFKKFNNLRSQHNNYTVNEIITKCKKIIQKNNHIDYPSIQLSHNWLILSSQLSTLSMAVFNKMVNTYNQVEKDTITQIHELN